MATASVPIVPVAMERSSISDSMRIDMADTNTFVRSAK